MYKLYDYDVHTLIDKSNDEGDIINTMSDILSKSIGQRFLIKHTDEETNTDDMIFAIKNVRDYYNYVLDYNERLKNMSCVELKQSILERNKPKSRKLSK